MNTTDAINARIAQLRDFDVRDLRNVDVIAELKKLDPASFDLASLDVLDLRNGLGEVRSNLETARKSLEDDVTEARDRVEQIVREFMELAAGFAPATRRDIESLARQLDEVEKAAKKAPAARKSTARKSTARKSTAKKATARKATAKKASAA